MISRVCDDKKNSSRTLLHGKLPKTFVAEGMLVLYRDKRMMRFAGRHGGEVSDARGENYITVFIWPHLHGVHFDVVTAELLPHPFTKWVVGSFAQAIGLWHHVRWVSPGGDARRQYAFTMPPGRLVQESEGVLYFQGRGGDFENRSIATAPPSSSDVR
jgi:hypothetical protein